MQPIEFVIQLSAMKHPSQRTVLELTSYKWSHQKMIDWLTGRGRGIGCEKVSGNIGCIALPLRV